MKSMRMPVLLASVILFGAGVAMAAPAVTVTVPFPFTVRDHVLPAGDYRIEEDDMDPGVLIIKSMHGAHVAVITRSVEASGRDPAGDQSALVLVHDGNGYRLKDVWQDREEGRELPVR